MKRVKHNHDLTLDLHDALAQHRRWRCGNGGGKRLKLKQESVIGIDLSGHDLSGAILFECAFHDCDLRGTDLSAADLRGTMFTFCDIDLTDFSGADMRGVKAVGLKLSQVKTFGARIDAEGIDGAQPF